MELSLLILVCIHKTYIVYLEIYVVPIGRGFLQHTFLYAPSTGAAQHWLTCPTLGFMYWASSRGRLQHWRMTGGTCHPGQWTALPYSRMDSSAPLVDPRPVTQEAGRVGLMGRERGRGSIEWCCTCIIYIALVWSHSVPLGVWPTHMHGDSPPATQRLALSAQAGLSGTCWMDRAYRQPTNMQPGTFCYHLLSSG